MKKIYFIFVFLIIVVLFILLTNKTFFRDKFNTYENYELRIPRFSFYVSSSSECAVFYSLKSIDRLDYEFVNNFLNIKNYNINNKGFYREIIICYK